MATSAKTYLFFTLKGVHVLNLESTIYLYTRCNHQRFLIKKTQVSELQPFNLWPFQNIDTELQPAENKPRLLPACQVAESPKSRHFVKDLGRGWKTCEQNATILYSAISGHEKKFVNFSFPTKYIIPKSLKVRNWLSKILYSQGCRFGPKNPSRQTPGSTNI